MVSSPMTPLSFVLEILAYLNRLQQKCLVFIERISGGSKGKESACHAGDWGSIPQSGRAPEKMATHSSILAWKIPLTEGPGRLQFKGWQSWTGLSDFHFHSTVVNLRKPLGIPNHRVFCIIQIKFPPQSEPILCDIFNVFNSTKPKYWQDCTQGLYHDFHSFFYCAYQDLKNVILSWLMGFIYEGIILQLPFIVIYVLHSCEGLLNRLIYI